MVIFRGAGGGGSAVLALVPVACSHLSGPVTQIRTVMSRVVLYPTSPDQEPLSALTSPTPLMVTLFSEILRPLPSGMFHRNVTIFPDADASVTAGVANGPYADALA